MMNKYKELPAFETNEFKVGDKVAFYRKCGKAIGEITSRSTNNLCIKYESRDKNTCMTETHFKQCRKLEEVKPREFNVIVTEDGEIITAPSHALPNFTFNNKPVTYIKVREVLDDN
ncbi:MAG TPA: hypothetical protein VIS27_09635 [Yeosuana sp.]